MKTLHLVGCPKEADPRNETCDCDRIRDAQRSIAPRHDPLAAAIVNSLVDAIEGLLDAPALGHPESQVGDDVRAIELAKANAEAARQFFPDSLQAGEYRPTASGLNLVLKLVEAAIVESGSEGVHPDELFEGFRRYGGSRELFDAMISTLQSSTRALIVGGRLVAVADAASKKGRNR
jgi:hypothetical protein